MLRNSVIFLDTLLKLTEIMPVHVLGNENGINVRVNCGLILDFVGGL